MFIPDFSKYINPLASVPQSNALQQTLESIARTNLERSRQAAQERQFQQTHALNQQQHSDTVAHQNRVASDINTRFALTSEQEYNKQLAERDHIARNLVDKTRQLVAAGNLNAVEANLGSLQDLGVKVDKTMNPDGTPSYRFEYQPKVYGRDADSSIDFINAGQPGTNPNVDRSGLQLTRPSMENQFQSPFTSSIGTTPTYQEKSQQSAPTSSPEPTSGYDPNTMNVGMLRTMNEQRLNPVLKGIEESFPLRFQSNIRPFLESIPSLGYSPEGALDAMQKPLDTISRLYGSELNAEGNMARASISQGTASNSEERLREVDAKNRAEKLAHDTGLFNEVKFMRQTDSLKQRINSGNQNAQADAIKELIALREGGRITDQDFTIGLGGIGSNISQLRDLILKVGIDGLNEYQLMRFNQMLDMLHDKAERNVAGGMKQMRTFRNSFRYEPERYAVDNWIAGAIPEALKDEEATKFDPQRNAGGTKVKRAQSQRSSSSVAVPAAPQPQPAEEVPDEFKEFLE